MSLTTVQFIVTEISAGIMEQTDGSKTPYASVTGVQNFPNNDQRQTGFSYGSPTLKIKLIDQNTGQANIKLAEDLRKANVFMKEVYLNCRTKITKQGMTFEALTIDDPQVKKAV
uniref:hypothetical protein n=1 Tax=Rheinheimera sp. TaxID=1869214 RepID=UPI004048508C